MKRILDIKRIKITYDPMEYDFSEKPIFYQGWNMKTVVGIYPRHTTYDDQDHKIHHLYSFDVYIGKEEGKCRYFNLSETKLAQTLSNPPEKCDGELYEAAEVIMGGCSIEDISEAEFKEYYNQYLDDIKLP